MANGISFAVPALLLGIVALTLLNVLYFFPWASVNHSATSDSIDRHERLITDIAEELGSLREVQEDLRSGLLSPFDRRVREALKGSRRDVQDFLNSPIFSEEAGKQRPPPAPFPKADQKKSEDPGAAATRPDVPAQTSAVSRQLPPPAIQFGATTEGSTLVVGGTDGSGTRRVVEVLNQLGVPMVSEDPETYDIHADIVGGWPKIVDPVIAETHSLNYDPSTLSERLRAETNDRVLKVLERAKGDVGKPESRILARGGRLSGPTSVHASGVSFGIKAPVAMVMVPWWHHMSSNFKFLHVVRDGRDIAFSANQGPVNKFYKTMYPNTVQRQRSTALQAIQLWSDWNSQIHEWSKNQPGSLNGQSYSYMLLHTEDLVDDRIPVKFGAIKQLAVWVNSDASDDYICCLAVKGSSFMGSHDRTSREDIKSASQSAMQLKQRYGKWRAQTSKNPKLASDLHEVGRQGLEILGYEPLRNFADDSTAWGDSKYQCTLTPADCGIKEPILEKSNGCTYQESTDFRAGSLRIDLSMTSATSAGDCCADCRGKEHCQHFSFDIRNNYCYLKSGTGNIVSGQEASGLISGSLI